MWRFYRKLQKEIKADYSRNKKDIKDGVPPTFEEYWRSVVFTFPVYSWHFWGNSKNSLIFQISDGLDKGLGRAWRLENSWLCAGNQLWQRPFQSRLRHSHYMLSQAYYSVCVPCDVEYNVIMKLETHDDDTEFLIRQYNLTELQVGWYFWRPCGKNCIVDEEDYDTSTIHNVKTWLIFKDDGRWQYRWRWPDDNNNDTTTMTQEPFTMWKHKSTGENQLGDYDYYLYDDPRWYLESW